MVNIIATLFGFQGGCMASLADLYTFQAMVWMYITAAMQWYAVLRPGGEGISPTSMVQPDHKWGKRG
jgi:hypothetical protein